VVGSLFSGDYNTSNYNTMHLCILLSAYPHYAARTLGRKELRGAWKNGYYRFKVQGDDIIASFAPEVKDHLNAEGLRQFLIGCGQVVKPGAYRVSSRLDVDFDERGELVDPDKSIVFLKRYIIKRGKNYLPFRPTRDYIFKMHASASAMLNADMYAAKILGLTLDTMGVNEFAHAMLRSYYAFVVKKAPDVRISRVKRALLEDKFVLQRFLKLGPVADVEELYGLCIDKNYLLSRVRGDHMTPEEILAETPPPEIPSNKY